MTLIKSISGIRGTIGGGVGDNLTPIDISRFTAAYAMFIKNNNHYSNQIIIGRDARFSGDMVNHIVIGTLIGCGLDVVDVGLSTTPTIEMIKSKREVANPNNSFIEQLNIFYKNYANNKNVQFAGRWI